MSLARFPISEPFGGVNLTDDPAELETNEAQLSLNVNVNEQGQLAERRGLNRFNTGLAVDTLGPRELFYWGDFGVGLLVSQRGQVYSMPAVAGGSASLRRSSLNNNIWRFAVMKDSGGTARAWMVAGPQEVPAKWDGSGGSAVDWANTPPRGKCITMWKNRMIIANDGTYLDRLWFSPVGDPEGTYGFVDLRARATSGEGGGILDVKVLGDNLIVLKGDSIWSVYDPVSFANRRLGEPGLVFFGASTVLDNKLYYFSRGGIWETDGENPPTRVSHNIDYYIDDRVGQVDYTTSIPGRLHGTRDGRLFLIVPTSSTASTLFEGRPRMSYQTKDGDTRIPWWQHSGFSPVALVDAVETVAGNPQGVTLMSTDDDAEILRVFPPGVTDDRGVAINSRWVTGWRGIQTEEPKERLRRVNVVHRGPLTLKVYRDFDLSTVKYQKSWPSPVGTAFHLARPEVHGRFHAVELANTALGLGWSIDALEVAYRGGKEH